MKKMGKLFVGMALVVWSGYVGAKTFTVQKSEQIAKRMEELKEVMLDIENFCERGCRYKLSNVREFKIVEKEDENHIYSWMYVDSTRDSKSFTLTTISLDEQGVLKLESKYPERQKIKELKEKSGLSHSSVFDDVQTVWTMKEIFDENGQFVTTQVDYVTKAEGDSFILRMFAGMVRSGLEQTAKELFVALKQENTIEE
jgi:hypothetical protein